MKPKLKQAPNGAIYPTESEMQISCVRAFATIHPGFSPLLFAIPNGALMGGKRTATGISIQAARMKAEGMSAGVPDLFLSIPRTGLHGLYMELKTPVNGLSAAQAEFARFAIGAGYAFAVVRSVDEFVKITGEYLAGTWVQPYAPEIILVDRETVNFHKRKPSTK